jgi:hypothetical protein
MPNDFSEMPKGFKNHADLEFSKAISSLTEALYNNM